MPYRTSVNSVQFGMKIAVLIHLCAVKEKLILHPRFIDDWTQRTYVKTLFVESLSLLPPAQSIVLAFLSQLLPAHAPQFGDDAILFHFIFI